MIGEIEPAQENGEEAFEIESIPDFHHTAETLVVLYVLLNHFISSITEENLCKFPRMQKYKLTTRYSMQ